MPVESSVLFAAPMQQGRQGLKQPVQQQTYGFVGFKLHPWRHFMDIFQWCYWKGVATAASRAEQICTALYRHFSSCDKDPATSKGGGHSVQAALPSAGCNSAQPRGSPAPSSKPSLSNSSWASRPSLRHRAPVCCNWKDDRSTANKSSQQHADAMSHCIKSNSQGCHGLTKAFLYQSFANGCQQRKNKDGYLSKLHKAADGCEKVSYTSIQALQLSAWGPIHLYFPPIHSPHHSNASMATWVRCCDPFRTQLKL